MINNFFVQWLARKGCNLNCVCFLKDIVIMNVHLLFFQLQMLFRLNMFTVCLCLCMNRPYQSYYFVPLVSFWFLVVWLTMAIVPQVTSTSCEGKVTLSHVCLLISGFKSSKVTDWIWFLFDFILLWFRIGLSSMLFLSCCF